MSIFRDITISWDGVDYVATPTMRLLRQIEGNGVSLTDVAHRASKGQPPVSHMAYIITALLVSAGAPVTEDAIYDRLINGKPAEALALAHVVLEAFAPSSGDAGKKPVDRHARGGRRKATPAT